MTHSQIRRRLPKEKRMANIIQIARELDAIDDSWTMPDIARIERCSLRLVTGYFTREELCDIVRKPA
jgi:hypothetical protein